MRLYPTILLFIILGASFPQVMAEVNVELSPTFVRIPLNKTQVFEITLTGDGKIHTLKAYGVGLDWATKNSWVGIYGKTEYISFTPEDVGEYVITVEMDNVRSSSSVLVYDPQEGSVSDLLDRIHEARSQASTPEDFARINEVGRLYNESRFELAEIRLDEFLEKLSKTSTQESKSTLPNIVLIFLLLLSAIVVTKLLF